MACISSYPFQQESIYAHYKFQENIGQVVLDYSTNAFHAVLGSTLLEENSDPIMTDRGAYFDQYKYISLPPNSLLPKHAIPLSNFWMIFFVYLSSYGRIFSIFENGVERLNFYQDESQLYLIFSQETNQDVVTQNAIPYGIFQLGTWTPVLIGLNTGYIPGCVSDELYLQTTTFSTIRIFSSLSLLSTYNITIGNHSTSFTGFISELLIVSSESCNEAFEVHQSSLCLSSESRPLYSSTSDLCECGSYSCTSQPLNCLKCDQTCGLYCKTTSTDCLNVVEICNSFAIVNGVCNTSVDYMENCQVQESSTVCITCSPGFTLGTGSNICCPSGSFPSFDLTCAPCHITCLECNGGEASNCTNCYSSSLQLVNGSCGCFGATFNNSGQCSNCLPECASCSNSDTCNTCLWDNFIIASAGRCICPNGFYLAATDSCQPCDQNCQTCSGGSMNECLSCKDLNSEIITSPGSCVCKSSYFQSLSSSLICLPCDPSCSSCTGPSVSDCLNCEDPLKYLSFSTCICKDRYYLSEVDSKTCLNCHFSCFSCTSGGINGCLTCSSQDMILDSGTCYCPNSLFFDVVSQTCIVCPSLCKNCTLEFGCVECLDLNMDKKNGVCICGLGTFWNSSSLKCQNCHSDCRTCTGPLQNQCETCANQSIYTESGRCSCDVSEFVISSNPLTCGPCHEDCTKCINQNQNGCTECKNDAMEIINGTCDCISGTFLNDSGLCQNCFKSCLTCKNFSENSCTSCPDGFYLNSNGTCQSCSKSCKNCFGPEENQCTTCQDESIIISNMTGTCKCEASEYISTRSPLTCKKCSLNCSSCQNNTICTSCSKGFSLSSGICLQNTFTLNLEVQSNNSIKLIFSEDLERNLRETQFNLISNNEKLKPVIEILSSSSYLIIIKKINFSKKEEISLIFQTILSKNSSVLYPLNYKFTLLKATPELTTALKSVKTVLINAAIGSGITSAFINNNDPYIWVSINTIQILSYTPLLNVDFPDFLEPFLSELRPLSIIEFSWLNGWVFECDSPSINPRFYYYGFNCKNFLHNSVEVFLSFFAGIVILVVLVIFRFFPFVRIKRYCYSKIQSYKYSFFIRFWIQAYVELLVPAVISINHVRYMQLSIESTTDRVNSTTGFIFIIVLFFTPLGIVLFYKIKLSKIKQNNEDFKKKYSPLIEEFKYDSNFMWFIPMILVERVLFVFVLYHVDYNPHAQVIICALIPCINILFIRITEIFHDKRHKRMIYFQESIIFSVISLIGLFLSDLTEKNKNIVGYFILGIVIFGISFGTVLSISISLKEAFQKCKKKKVLPKIITPDDLTPIQMQDKNFESRKFLDCKSFMSRVPYNSNVHSPIHSFEGSGKGESYP